MKLTYKFRNPKTEHLDILCSISKKLYNQANWYIRQDFFNLENWLRYQDLNFILKSSIHYKLLKAQTSQQILRSLDKNWKSFFNAIKEWKKNRKKFNGRPKPPKYKKNCNNLLIFTNQNSRIKKNVITLTMSQSFKKKFPELGVWFVLFLLVILLGIAIFALSFYIISNYNIGTFFHHSEPSPPLSRFEAFYFSTVTFFSLMVISKIRDRWVFAGLYQSLSNKIKV